MEGVPLTLPLAVLELLTGAGLTVLLPLAGARIAREQPRFLQWLAKLVVETRDGARQSVADRAGLAGGAAALDRHEHVELSDGVRDRQRLRDDHPQRLAREVVLEGAAVDDDASGAGLDPHTGHRRLAPPSAVEPVEHGRHLSPLRRLRRTCRPQRERGRLLGAVRMLGTAI